MNREIILIAFVFVNIVLMILAFGNMRKINKIKPMNDASRNWYVSMSIIVPIVGFIKTRLLLNKIRVASN